MKTIMACCMLCLPLKNLRVTFCFGYRSHPVTGKYAFHAGVDLRAKHDTVFAIMDGSVRAAGYDDFLGIYVRLDHGDLWSSYGHLSQLFVATGDTVTAGEPIGITGATGRVTGEHLHFSLQYRHQYIDPIKFLYQTLINQDHGK
jgi:murein DD-endopeptidase MepM/ murein hydrolase activator NlpD